MLLISLFAVCKLLLLEIELCFNWTGGSGSGLLLILLPLLLFLDLFVWKSCVPAAQGTRDEETNGTEGVAKRSYETVFTLLKTWHGLTLYMYHDTWYGIIFHQHRDKQDEGEDNGEKRCLERLAGGKVAESWHHGQERRGVSSRENVKNLILYKLAYQSSSPTMGCFSLVLPLKVQNIAKIANAVQYHS